MEDVLKTSLINNMHIFLEVSTELYYDQKYQSNYIFLIVFQNIF